MEQLSASKLAFFASLLKKKHRRANGLTLAEGRKLVLEALHSNWVIDSLILTARAYTQLEVEPKCPVWIATDRQFERLSEMVSPDGWGVVLHLPGHQSRLPFKEERGLVLQGINDPGNVGTLIRLADWFGLDGVWVDGPSADPHSPKVLRASMGSAFRIPVHQLQSLDELLICFKEKLIVADLKGQGIDEAMNKLVQPSFILLGNESHGIDIHPEVYSQLWRVCIPRYGQAESLNVSSAAAILCWAFWGQGVSKSEG